MGELLWLWKDFAQHLAFGLLFALAMLRGAAPERLLAGMFIGMWAVHRAYHFVVGGSILYHSADLGHLAIDLAILLASFAVALNANRLYPLWIGAAQIIAILAHLYRVALTEINQFAYDMMSIMPSYIQLLALGLGLLFHMWRQKKLGSYPSWRGSLPPSRGTDRRTLRAH